VLSDLGVIIDFDVVQFQMFLYLCLLHLFLSNEKLHMRLISLLDGWEEESVGEEDRVVIYIVSSQVHDPIDVVQGCNQ
jgi:hypothetical protein